MNNPRLPRLATVVLCGALLGSLSGCVEMMVGSAVVGAVATSDRRTFGAQTEDKAITVKAEMRVPNIIGEAGHVNINSFNRKVLLTGEVKDEAMKTAVEHEVQGIAGVQSVVNEMEITGPSRYTSRSSDALITTKVKANLFEMKTVSAYSFKVVTERGIVYLMGRVSQREGTVASDVARSVSGVQKVVKIFDYVSEDELNNMAPQASTAKE